MFLSGVFGHMHSWDDYAVVLTLAVVSCGALALITLRRHDASRLAAHMRRAALAKERSPERESFMWAGLEGLLMTTTIANLIGLTFMNSYLMRQAPLAGTLTAAQMLSTSIVATCINACRGKPCFGGISWTFWACKVLPLAALFAVYLFTSNLVYQYLGVGFIQMLKPANGIMLFAASFGLGLEGPPDGIKALNVIVISGAVAATALAKANDDPDGVSTFGIGVMAISIVSATLYQIGIQLLMQHESEALDPVTLLTVMAPTTTAFLAARAARVTGTRASPPHSKCVLEPMDE